MFAEITPIECDFGPQTDQFHLTLYFPSPGVPTMGAGKGGSSLIQTHQNSEHYTTICSDNILHTHRVWFQSQHHLKSYPRSQQGAPKWKNFTFRLSVCFYWKQSCENTKK